MAAALGFRGIVDLDLRFDPRDAQYKLLDFNPRLGAQFRLFTTGTGVDVARAAYLDLTGQPVAAGEMTPGPAVPGGELRPARRGRLLAPAVSSGRGPGQRRCAGWTRRPGWPATTCGRSA